ncbi:HET-domain-containing protein [Cadophora sp. DSE1049]|nr:HET-domain-containing protein [Cadophora sp. DSE1049]
MTYEYRKLDTAKREIRLISLRPATSFEIQCDITHQSLDTATYHTLSYEWAQPEQGHTILLDNLKKDVRPNLFNALRRLRDKVPGELLWIDALCIDQGNDSERSSQVNMMGDIYECSKKTFVWLGEEAEDSSLAMKLLSSITANVQNSANAEAEILARLEVIGEDRSVQREKSWIALRKLFERPYWKRVWIIQEIFLSHPTTLLCGNEICKWDDICSLITLVTTQGVRLHTHEGRIAVVDRLLPPRLLVEIFHRRRQDKANFLDYLLLSRQRSTSDARDHVYGVLGLTRPRIVDSDYEKTVENVYREVVENMIVGDGNLDILSACCEVKTNAERLHKPLQGLGGSPKSGMDPRSESNPTLPSWIPDWRVPFKTDYDEYQVFPLCNNPYFAGGTGRPEIKYTRGSDTVTIRGIFLDSIAVVSTDLKTTRWQQVSDDWATWSRYDYLFTPYGDLEEQREAFRETFYLGLHNKDNPHKDDGGREFFDIAVRRRGDGVTKEQLGPRTFGRAGRQFFGTANGYMGRGPHGMQVGDLVVVLLGAKVPFVLRKAGETGRLLLVGECYVHGIMRGELVQESTREQEDFCLI